MTNLDDYCANSQPLFPFDAPYEVCLCLRCLNIVNADDGERVYCQKQYHFTRNHIHVCNTHSFDRNSVVVLVLNFVLFAYLSNSGHLMGNCYCVLSQFKKPRKDL